MVRHWGLWCAFMLIGAACTPLAQPRLTIEEYLLTVPPDLSTDNLVFHFANGDQQQILARTEAFRDFHQQVSEYDSQALAPFGYSLRGYLEDSRSYSEIYRGEQLIARDVVFLYPASVSASGKDFLVRVDMPDGQYLLTRDHFEKQAWPPARTPYLYVGDRLLSVEIVPMAVPQALARVYVGDNLAYESKFNDVSTYGSMDGPWAYGSHWALVLLDGVPDAQGGMQMVSRVIQDGTDLNATRHYEQSFQFAVLEGQPFYFYQRDQKIGVSFAGRELAPTYDELPHYQCCTGSLLNPGISMKMVWFFARRGADWYYVQAYVPSTKFK